MLLTILDLVGIGAFAASGAMIGVQRRLDIYGICVVGVMTGGTHTELRGYGARLFA